MHKNAILKVYYNSACPVCNAGITSQKQKSSDCGVEWKDVHVDPSLAQELGASLEFIRERLHVVDENGGLQVGISAFIVIWRHSPGERWKARFFGLPGVMQLAGVAYNMFAYVLYCWNRRMKHW